MADVVTSMLVVAVPAATPLVLGGLSGLFSERAGVVNIAIEGMMLSAAFAGFMAGVYTNSLGVALLVAALTGGVMAALHAVLSIAFQVDQIISGTVINILAVGLTGYLDRQVFPSGAPGGQRTLPQIDIPLLSDIPFIGEILFQQGTIVYLAFILVVLSHVVLFHTRAGLRIRAVGEHPLAAETAGVRVLRVRYLAVIAGGLLAGLGGAYFTLQSIPQFQPLMTNGRGFIALAALIFGKWTPFGLLGAALFFAIAETIPSTLQIQGVDTIAGVEIPYQIFGLLPYVLTILVLAGAVGRATPPAAVGVPYARKA
ncbi:MAG: ABC transporter permease [Dehalococcoidia bacterium]